MEIYGKIRKDIGVILRRLCEQKGIEIIEAELCPDHIYMLVSIPPKYSVASIMGYLYVDTVGKNKKAIEEYIRNQLQEDIAEDQISIKEKEYIDPFEKEKKEKERKIKKGIGPLKW